MLLRSIGLLLSALLIGGNSVAQSFGTGTGFFVSSTGHFVTNAHVIAGAEVVVVRTASGERVRAEIISVDRANDLALLKVPLASVPIAIAPSSILKKGIKVYTLGFPSPQQLGFKETKYAEGVVSSLSGNEDDPTVIQVSTPLQPGNSGGPILAEGGVAVGIVKSKPDQLATLRTKGFLLENVSFAIKTDYLRPILEASGIRVASMSPARSIADMEKSIVLVISVTKGTAQASQPDITFASQTPGTTTTTKEDPDTESGRTIRVARERGFKGFQFSTLGPNDLEYGIISQAGGWLRIRTKSGHHLEVYRGIGIVYDRTSQIGAFLSTLIDDLPLSKGRYVERAQRRGFDVWNHKLTVLDETIINTVLGPRPVHVVEHSEKGTAGNSFHEVSRTWVDTEFQIPWKREVDRLGGRPSEKTPFEVVLIKAP